MESEERSKKVARYVERWNGDTLEVMGYAGRMKSDRLDIVGRPRTHLKCYQRVLILPLPTDLDWKKLVTTTSLSFPNSIIIIEDRVRWKRNGKKRFRPLYPFLEKPGMTTVKEVMWRDGIGEGWSKVWINKEKYMKITKRNTYVDYFYANQIFNKSKNSSGL